MPLDDADWPSELATDLPGEDDALEEGDDAIRGLKLVFKNAFPAVAGAVTASHVELNMLDGLTGNIRTSTSTPLAGEMVLMKATTISGAPSAVDFVNGSGGVVFSTAYDEYLLVMDYIRHGSSANAKLRLDFSTNAGSSFGAATCEGSGLTVTDTTLAGLNYSGILYAPIMAEHANASPTAAGMQMIVRLIRPVADTSVMGIFSEYAGYTGIAANRTGCFRGRADAGGAIDAIRVMWDTGSFANVGTIKLFGRKV